MAFSADGRQLALVGNRGGIEWTEPRVADSRTALVELWDSDGALLRRTFLLPKPIAARQATFSPDNRKVVYYDGVEGRIQILELEPGTLGTVAAGQVFGVQRLAFSSDGGRLALGTFGRVHVLDFDRPTRSAGTRLAADWVSTIAFQTDGRHLSLAAGSRTIAWAPDTPGSPQVVSHEKFAANRSTRIIATRAEPIAAAFDGSATRMAIAARGGSIQLWDGAGGKQTVEVFLAEADGTDHWLDAPALSSDGEVVGALASNERLALWNFRSGAPLQSVSFAGACGARWGHPLGDHLALNGDGSLAAFVLCGQVVLFDTRAGNIVQRFKGQGPLKFANDETIMAGVREEIDGVKTDSLRAWSTRDGAMRWTFSLPRGVLMNDFALSPNGNIVAVAGSDKLVRIWDRPSRREAMSVALVADGWVALTPDGFFDASQGGAEKALLVRHGEGLFDVLPVASFREKYYRPDILREIIAGNAASVAAQMGPLQLSRPPKVSLGRVPETLTEGSLELLVSLRDQGGGIGELRVYVNGTAVAAQVDRGLVRKTASDLRHVRVRLAAGTNDISVIAFDAGNSVSSEPEHARVQVTLPYQKKPQLHALIVGIERFENPALNLRYAVNDALAVAEVVRRQANGLFEKVNVQVLTDPANTTRAALIKALSEYRNVDPEDVFLFYVASHGTVEGDDLASKEYFLLTSNVGSTSVRALRRDAIGQKEIKTLIANIGAGKKTLLLDTCHSGELGAAIQGGARGIAEDAAVKVLSNAIGSTVISASTSQQQSLEGYNNHGVFTWVLLQALGGKADVRSRGYITTLDLANFVEDEVPKLAERVFNAKQFPNLHSAGQAFPLVLSRPAF